MSHDLVVGIDLGTTFSAIAYINSYGKSEIIPNREGERTTPSMIFFEHDGTPVVGREARNLAMTDPTRVVQFLKREMGNPSYRFNIDGRDYFPEDLSAMLLKKLKNDAEEYLGKEIKKVVISVPAYFKDAQRECTKQAGQIAGLEVLRIINEPTAAALAYGMGRSEHSKQYVMVYDFGGGTFDVTLMKINGNRFEILATIGDSHLGGKDVDEGIVNYLAQEFIDTYGIDLRKDRRSRQDLWDKAEIAKRDLSFRNQLALTLVHKDQALRVDLDRQSFGELIHDVVTKTEDYMNKVLEATQLEWKDVDTILLAGGSSRIPVVQDMIKRVTGKEAARTLNPDECVAMGAAIQSFILTEDECENRVSNELTDTLKRLVIKDIASHSLGVKALTADQSSFVNSIIIPRYTTLPVERTRYYATSEDNQQKVEIEVLQGEHEDPNSPEIDLIGRVQITDLPPHKAGELVIEVTLKYDLNGVIEVVATEQKSGKVIREVVMQKSGSLSKEIIEERKQLLDLLRL
ncbi:Hsp70 family protein [Hazenella coriacea]|uniref:Chaperone protein DnaK n=1 Tax=Hazenella coriacea TaxID=1179467 RepID=A0A4R3L3Z5_9BACL|nr:Hsp70 family protein [Hazenella coriacea]TCS94269.1 molecular chaperone DnaK [Hazenella coriacea]